MIRLFAPFPERDYPLLWEWLHEYPESNFDDSGPKTFAAFAREMNLRIRSGQIIHEVISDQRPVGAIGYARVNDQAGRFHGICFSKQVHGSGVALEAVSEVLKRAFEDGVEVVEARYFLSNQRIRRFLFKLGASEEAMVWAGSIQKGHPIDWVISQISRSTFHRLADQSSSVSLFPSCRSTGV